MTEERGGEGRAGEGREGREIGWEESECHPSAAFQITLNSGKPDASRTLSPGLCCLWLPSTGCLSSLIGLTFPLSVLAVPRFSYVRWSGGTSENHAERSHRQTPAAPECKQNSSRKEKKKRGKKSPRTTEEQLCMADYPTDPVDLQKRKEANLFKASLQKNLLHGAE